MIKDKRRIKITIFILTIFALLAFLFIRSSANLRKYLMIIGALLFAILIYYTLKSIKKNTKALAQFEIDPLTQLFNLRGFNNDVKDKLKNEELNDYYIVRFEIDKFKLYNEIFGMAEGDEALKKIADILRELQKRKEIVSIGHANSDHFLFCLNDKNIKIKEFSNQIKEMIENCVDDYRFSINIGYANILDLDIGKYCEQTLLAIQTIKDSYDKLYAVYNDEMSNELLIEKQILNDAQIALEKGYFKVYFQPQYEYHSKAILGAEALIRWIDPIKGMIQPGAFIPVFEKNGFIYEVDKYTWNYVCRKIRQWKDEGIKIPNVSINISRRDLYHTDFIQMLNKIVNDNGLEPSDLHLEITESAIMENPDLFIDVLKRLKQNGFYLEMDDFGSGYSALNSLKDLPFDLVKLDLCFMSSSNTVGKGGSILSSIVRLLYQINIPVLAEGVETKQQAEFLKSIGCYYMQGYYFSKPLPEEEFVELIKNQKEFEEKQSLFNSNDDHAIDFLDDRTQSALLFNSFVGGAFILEYRGNAAEVIRTNTRFLKELGIDYKAWANSSKQVTDFLTEESNNDFIQMLDKAIVNDDETETTICIDKFSNGEKIYCHVRSRFLAKKVDTYIFYCMVENITKRLEDEEKIRISEQVYRAVANQSRLVIMRYYKNDNHLDINLDVSDYNFTKPDHLYPEYFIDKNYIRNKDIEVWNSVFDNIKNGLNKGSVENLLVYDNDNVEHYYNVNYRNLISSDDKQTVAVIALREITKEYLEEQTRITEYNAAFKALNRIYSVTIACNLTDNTFYLINNSSSNSKGFEFGTYDDLFNVYIKTIPYEEDRKAFTEAFERNNVIESFAKGNKNITIEHRHKGSDNIEHWMETSIIGIDNKDNDDIFAVYASRNIDEIKRNEEIARHVLNKKVNQSMIKEVEEAMVKSLTSIGKTVLRYDIQTKTLISPSDYAKKLGVPEIRTNVPNNQDISLITEGDEALKEYNRFFNDMLAGVPHGQLECNFTYADGSIVYERNEYNTIFDENGKPIRAIISLDDVTNVYKEKTQIEKQNEALKSLIGLVLKTNYENILLINTDDYSYISYRSKDDNVLIDSTGNVKEQIQRVANYFKDEKVREDFLKKTDLKEIKKQLTINGKYTLTYELDGKNRVANFYPGQNEKQIILTIVK